MCQSEERILPLLLDVMWLRLLLIEEPRIKSILIFSRTFRIIRSRSLPLELRIKYFKFQKYREYLESLKINWNRLNANFIQRILTHVLSHWQESHYMTDNNISSKLMKYSTKERFQHYRNLKSFNIKKDRHTWIIMITTLTNN